MTPAETGGGGVTQRDLEAVVALRRRAREAHDEWRAGHLAIGARLRGHEACEPGRYRVQLQTVEGGAIVAIWDREDPRPYPGCTAAFTREELARERSRTAQAEAEAAAHAQAEAPAEAPGA